MQTAYALAEMNAPTAVLASGQTVVFWTVAAVEDRLREALRTLSKLPLTEADYPAQLKSNWQATVQRLEDWLPQPGEENFQQKWKAAREMLDEIKNRPPRFVASTEEVTRMEEALAWQHFVSQRRYWQALAAHCMGASLRAVAKRLSTSHETANAWRRKAASEIVMQLNSAA